MGFMKWYEKMSTGTGVLGAVMSSTNFDLLLNRILLIFSILNILIVLAFKIYDKIKDRKVTSSELEELKNELEEAKEEIEALTNKDKEV